MIRIIGLDKNVFEHVVENYPYMIEHAKDNKLTIEFKRECYLEFSSGIVSVMMESEGIDPSLFTINIMCIDFYRVEIE